MEQHEQSGTHLLYILHPDSRLVPVPTGQGLPRCDRPATSTRFKRLMLVLFKPWRTVADLKAPEVTWDAAYDEFTKTCSSEYTSKMDNMQVLHECKDSKDDYFTARR
ncbi:hypothetical protein C8F01DRAFT_990817, partial [Mycena amicta]